MVGLAGLEPATSRTRSVRASQLRYSPQRSMSDGNVSVLMAVGKYDRRHFFS